MKSAALLRVQIEDSLSARIPVALSPRERVVPEKIASGNTALDELLGGGLPVGVLTEFVGADGSGRTTAALACVAAIMQAGSVCAWIDVNDALDPETVAANGVDLERLLWVRCGSAQSTSNAASEVPQRIYDPVPSSATQPRHTGGGSPHPRSEGRDMPQAISAMLHEHGGLYDRQVRREKRVVGTPGVPNRPLTHRSEHREEQVNSDRLPPRRGENLAVAPRCAEPQPRHAANAPSGERLLVKQSTTREMSKSGISPWKALDQALRATDLLLQSGGFSAIVLDMGSVRPEFAWRIPLATWFRFRTACERTRVSLILLTQYPCARSSAELVVRLQPGVMESQSKVMTGIHYCGAIERSRSMEREGCVVPIRKPPQPERPGEWTSEASWTLAK